MSKIPIGMVGLNWGLAVIRDQLIQGPASEQFELAAVCCKERDKVDACAREFGVRAYYQIEDLLRDRDIPVVGLMTGPAGRAGLIRRAVEAEKHVMTTKPVEIDPEAALEVLRFARERKRVVHLNSPAPLPSPDLRQIFKWQRELQLGRPVAARADIWANYRESPDGSWYDDPSLCPVAPILRLGIYLLNDLVRLFGRPDAVSVMSSRLFTNRPTADNAQLSLMFQSGAIANVFSSFCVNDAQWWLSSLTLNYENGTIYRNVGPTKGSHPREKPELEVVVNRDGRPHAETHVASASTEDYQWPEFYRAIRGEPVGDEMQPEEMVLALRVIRAMSRAEKSNRIEPVV